VSISFHRRGGFRAGSVVSRSVAKTLRARQFGAMVTIGAVGPKPAGKSNGCIGLTGRCPPTRRRH
jgi:hypothetical protein